MKSLYLRHKDFIMEVIHFGLVGVANTLLGWGIMSVLYNLAHLSYWLSSGISYFIGSVFSYHANGRLTFPVEEKDAGLPWRFAGNILFCYLTAFGAAKPLVRLALSTRPWASLSLIDNIAMVLGMGLFIVMNFFGQKLFVFRGRRQRRDG